MTLVTTLEIDEIETDVLIHFDIVLGEPEINKMTDISNGCAIAPDLFDSNLQTKLLNQLHEAGCDILAEKRSQCQFARG